MTNIVPSDGTIAVEVIVTRGNQQRREKFPVIAWLILPVVAGSCEMISMFITPFGTRDEVLEMMEGHGDIRAGDQITIRYIHNPGEDRIPINMPYNVTD
jgi:hypothetical protein